MLFYLYIEITYLISDKHSKSSHHSRIFFIRKNICSFFAFYGICRDERVECEKDAIIVPFFCK